jgi:hypothetical protein
MESIRVIRYPRFKRGGTYRLLFQPRMGADGVSLLHALVIHRYLR